MIPRTVVSGMLILLLGALNASGQTASVTGRGTDSLRSAPIAGATVSAIYPGGSNVLLAEAVTDANGQYVFGVAPGTYNALADLPVGAAIDPTGRFFWQPGPGFAGRFELLFVQTTCDGTKKRVPLSVVFQAR